MCVYIYNMEIYIFIYICIYMDKKSTHLLKPQTSLFFSEALSITLPKLLKRREIFVILINYVFFLSIYINFKSHMYMSIYIYIYIYIYI